MDRKPCRRHHSKAGDNNSDTVYFCCSSGQAKARSSLQFSVQENYDENIECNLLWITAFAKCINVHFTLLFQLQKQLLFFFAEWIIKNEEIEFPNIDYRNAHSVKETVISGEICVRLI